MGLWTGLKWASKTVSYSMSGFTAEQRKGVHHAFDAWEDVSGLKFVPVSHGSIHVSASYGGGYAWAYYPPNGDITLNVGTGFFKSMTPGLWSYHTTMHEIGHAIGLAHGHEPGRLPAAHDAHPWSIMTYRSYLKAPLGQSTEWRGSYPQTPMMEDIKAVQAVYGPNWKHNSGNTVYKFDPRDDKIFETVWDGGGRDTYSLSAYTSAVKIDLRPGQWTTTDVDQVARLSQDGKKLAPGNAANAYLYKNSLKSIIENAIGGSGNDQIIGNQAANILKGGAGNDRLYGREGNDHLYGGPGRDVFYVGQGVDRIHDFQPGIDVIRAVGNDDWIIL